MNINPPLHLYMLNSHSLEKRYVLCSKFLRRPKHNSFDVPITLSNGSKKNETQNYSIRSLNGAETEMIHYSPFLSHSPFGLVIFVSQQIDILQTNKEELASKFVNRLSAVRSKRGKMRSRVLSSAVAK